MVAARLALFLGLFVAMTNALGGPQSMPSLNSLKPSSKHLSSAELNARAELTPEERKADREARHLAYKVKVSNNAKMPSVAAAFKKRTEHAKQLEKRTQNMASLLATANSRVLTSGTPLGKSVYTLAYDYIPFLGNVAGLTVGCDGDVYISDADYSVVRCVGKNDCAEILGFYQTDDNGFCEFYYAYYSNGLDVNSHTGEILIVDYHGDSVFSYNPLTGSIKCTASSLNRYLIDLPRSIAYDKMSGAFLVSNDGSAGVPLIDMSGNPVGLYSTPNASFPDEYTEMESMVTDLDGHVYYLTKQNGNGNGNNAYVNGIQKCNIAANACTHLVSNLAGSPDAFGMAVSNGFLYYYDYASKEIKACDVTQVDTCTTFISGTDLFDTYSLGNVQDPFVKHIAIDKINGIMYFTVNEVMYSPEVGFYMTEVWAHKDSTLKDSSYTCTSSSTSVTPDWQLPLLQASTDDAKLTEAQKGSIAAAVLAGVFGFFVLGLLIYIACKPAAPTKESVPTLEIVEA